ncbi:MAG: CPBP family intramembrane metalloprotease [Acidobacteriota bacterium]|nr:CPBP family intramembrane metalloprotease [Acidobacteriota bacterium]
MGAIFFGDEGLRAGWRLVIYFVLVASFLAVALRVAGHLQSGQPTGNPAPQRLFTATSALATEWLEAAAVALATFVMAAIEGRRATAYGLASRRPLWQLACGMFWGVTLLTVLVVILKSQGLLVVDGRVLQSAAAVRYGLLWMVAFLGVGLFEETFFRGFLLWTLAGGLTALYRRVNPRLAPALGFWSAAFLLSFGFGGVHSSNPGESPIGIVAAGIAGLVFTYSIWRTGSLWWAIGFHAAWDWAESYLYGVADSGNIAEGHLFATHPHGSAVLSGGLTGPEGSIWVLPTLLVTAVIIRLTLHDECKSAGSARETAAE